MNDQILFCIVFLSQIFLISLILPHRVLERLRYVVQHYPPQSYPRLYPVPMPQVERAQRNYRVVNLLVLAVGLALLAYAAWTPSEELLGWDTKTVVFLYYMLQYSPLMIATTAGFTYFNLKRKPDTRSTRRASLRPRRLLDYVSPVLVGGAVLVFVAFVVFIGWMRTFGFAWFGGWWNVAGIAGMNVAFALLIAYSLHGRKKDPYMAQGDRDRAIELNAKSLLFISIAATAYVTLSIGLSALDLRHLSPVMQSLYFQVVSVAAFRGFRIDNVNFEVYREDPVRA